MDVDIHFGGEDVHLEDEDVQFVLLKQPLHMDEDLDVDIHLGDEDVQKFRIWGGLKLWCLTELSQGYNPGSLLQSKRTSSERLGFARPEPLVSVT